VPVPFCLSHSALFFFPGIASSRPNTLVIPAPARPAWADTSDREISARKQKESEVADEQGTPLMFKSERLIAHVISREKSHFEKTET
jgi:hypothetical protein